MAAVAITVTGTVTSAAIGSAGRVLGSAGVAVPVSAVTRHAGGWDASWPVSTPRRRGSGAAADGAVTAASSLADPVLDTGGEDSRATTSGASGAGRGDGLDVPGPKSLAVNVGSLTGVMSAGVGCGTAGKSEVY
ncbi:hypothetical protein MARA_07460 [Mycolicibacterium arabiense]|uniref:Uncharacterized protein n=1 Tax=Mycolicibacterium arabiense TaxID=1286181 RepID=A0A7I7RRS1_9MYCO|nr:hypothetical protein MARA_07460 [Mycolicibacterium arabiense]